MGKIRENALKAYHHEIPEWIPSFGLDIEIFMAYPEMERYIYDIRGTDAFGVEWTYVPEIGAPMPTPGKHLLEDISHWKEVVTIPDVEAVADYKIQYLKKIRQYYNPDIVCCHDDYGTQQNLFMSPDIWRELLKPYLARIVKACHDLGMIYEHHSCGKFQDLVPDMVEIGITAIDSWQTCNDRIRQLKDAYQDRLTFVGGFDNVATFGRADVTPGEIRAEYHRCAGLLGPGGSFVRFPSGLKGENMGVLMQEHMKCRSDYCRK